MSGLTVIVTGLSARELGASARAQLIAASCVAVGAVTLFVGHLLSTTTFDLLAWASVTWLLARTLRTGEQRLWLGAGLVAGLALLNKPLIAFLVVGLGAGFILAGPSGALRGPWPWAGCSSPRCSGLPGLHGRRLTAGRS
jgi:4-amino-4-deoxy-L-arabinose transferase-like glycosyltransferase